jgi:hypothetical protein
MNPLIQLKKANPLFLLGVACFGFLPMAQALLPPPPPDGGYPNGNTAEGTNALFNIPTGSANTAIGFQALHENTIGINNTAIGNTALHENRTGAATRPPACLPSVTTEVAVTTRRTVRSRSRTTPAIITAP